VARAGALACLVVTGMAVLLVYANNQTKHAEAERRRTQEVLELIQIQRAEEFFKSDKAHLALAHLAAVIRKNPANRVAVERAISALIYRSFPVPLLVVPHEFDPSIHASNFNPFSPDGQRIVIASSGNTTRVWDVRTGEPISELLRHAETVWSAQFSPDG
jgi:hypothetical protein